ncbi:DUF4388 domain-containing protein [Candidatus Fermentibacteria bacterium]|nr:DUF4388 domain-containing protein [Candidatus Fermentibacteria bacterium]
MTASPDQQTLHDDRPSPDSAGIRLVGGRQREARGLRLAVVGPEKTQHLAGRVSGRMPVEVMGLSSLSQAQCWLTGHYADGLLVDSAVLGEVPVEWLVGFRSSPLCVSAVMCVVGEGSDFVNRELLRSLRAWSCSYDDEEALCSFLECGAGVRVASRSNFALSGALPGGGIRVILPMLEAERRSGRLVIEPVDSSAEQLTVWIRDGEPIAAYASGVRCKDPLGHAQDIADGWFSFVETAVDRDVLLLLDAWSDRVTSAGEAPRAHRAGGELRERLRVALAAARTIGEMRDAVQSLLDMGIDKAAEDGDTSLMDSLADVSILLQKNRIDDAFELLKRVMK